MKEGFEVFKDNIDLTTYALSGFLGVIVYSGIGIVITTILQSSSASLALILTALAAGQIEYENALALSVGANIGTTITAVIGSLSSNVAGKRLAGAHLIFNLLTGIVALALIYPLANLVNHLSFQLGIASADYTLKLALFHTIFNVLGVILMLPLISFTEKLLVRTIKEKKDKGIDEPKYLNESILKFPSTAISSLTKESKHLYENAIFEIVTHALNIHREDIKSGIRAGRIIKNSKEDLKIDVRYLYYSKVKSIYSEIIKYVTLVQSNLKMTKDQSNSISEILVANRKMVQIIKTVLELNRNVSKYSESDNLHIDKEYNKFRKKLVKVLRVIYLFRTEADKEYYYSKLIALKKEMEAEKNQATMFINVLINKNLITAEMASSLVNDKDNLNEIIQNLIMVAELLYGQKDSLLENGEKNAVVS